MPWATFKAKFLNLAPCANFWNKFVSQSDGTNFFPKISRIKKGFDILEVDEKNLWKFMTKKAWEFEKNFKSSNSLFFGKNQFFIVGEVNRFFVLNKICKLLENCVKNPQTSRFMRLEKLLETMESKARNLQFSSPLVIYFFQKNKFKFGSFFFNFLFILGLFTNVWK